MKKLLKQKYERTQRGLKNNRTTENNKKLRKKGRGQQKTMAGTNKKKQAHTHVHTHTYTHIHTHTHTLLLSPYLSIPSDIILPVSPASRTQSFHTNIHTHTTHTHAHNTHPHKHTSRWAKCGSTFFNPEIDPNPG